MKTKIKQPEFVPLSKKEARRIGWEKIDILLISGDAYVDHPSFGTALIARTLINAGFRVGIIAQPDWKNPESLKKFGRPEIGCAITSGNIDSMVNLYTAGRRLRKNDAYSPGGKTGLRPPHAVVVYTNLAKQAFPKIFTVIGGIEASLRRVAHYDYWQDKIKPGILTESKADILVYGMGEITVPEIFRRKQNNEDISDIRGTARFPGGNESKKYDENNNYIELPGFENIKNNPDELIEETKIIEKEMNPYCAKGLKQKYQKRWLVIEPPQFPLPRKIFDEVSELPYANKPHHEYKKNIPAFVTVKDSIQAVRGCPGGCSFCGLTAHQGRFISSRSRDSILKSIKKLTKLKSFRGTVSDIGGAAGNIYGNKTENPELCRKCRRYSCIHPNICKNYSPDGDELIKLLRETKKIPGVKHVHINSGIRLNLAEKQKKLMREIIRHHVSGHLKVAPEHLHNEVLKLMRKDSAEDFENFMDFFENESQNAGKKQYLIPLFISNFPGSTDEHMKKVDKFLAKHNWSPQQVQDFIPLPMTMAAAMYYAAKTPDGKKIKVNRGLKERRPQLKMLKKKRHKRKN